MVRTTSSLLCRVHRSRELFLRKAFLTLVHPYDMREEFKHRDKLSHIIFPINACVARPVPKSEIAKSPGARASLDCEWKRLRDKSVWDESTVKE
eukprot:9552460-Heterocapsa_arctica.AAC.1